MRPISLTVFPRTAPRSMTQQTVRPTFKLNQAAPSSSRVQMVTGSSEMCFLRAHEPPFFKNRWALAVSSSEASE